ncbi:MAG TPA: hypothetical protein VLX92_18655, partial [Kofleriaceae bacterium]|nr:hypothetical protein [Kofleriaceae bacterium]
MLFAAACGTGDNRVDPGDLELRDLLGIAPETAASWNADQRASARQVIAAGLRATADPAQQPPDDTVAGDDRLARAIAALDARRADAGDAALGLIQIGDGTPLVLAGKAAPDAATAELGVRGEPALELRLDGWSAPAWQQLPGRGLDVLAALAQDAGVRTGPVVVAPAPRLAAIAGYVATPAPRLLINPVALAALEPDPSEAVTLPAAAAPPGAPLALARSLGSAATAPGAPGHAADVNGNPYSFYGSYEECAQAQRQRCEACLPNSSCTPVTNTSDGNAECTMLDANGGRGYYLLCINLSLAISSVASCTKGADGSCAQNDAAADDLADLESNSDFLDQSDCASALDGCLAKIYGAPSQSFPGPDGGEATEPPRSTSVACSNSCSNDQNCQASPNCSCTGPSCNNSLSCDSACSSSNDQHGCNSDCSSCSSGSNAPGSGGGCSGSSGGSSSGCNSSSGSSSSSGCDSCGSSSGSSSGGSCGSCSSSGSNSSSGCSGGSCGGSGSGGCGGSN